MQSRTRLFPLPFVSPSNNRTRARLSSTLSFRRARANFSLLNQPSTRSARSASERIKDACPDLSKKFTLDTLEAFTRADTLLPFRVLPAARFAILRLSAITSCTYIFNILQSEWRSGQMIDVLARPNFSNERLVGHTHTHTHARVYIQTHSMQQMHNSEKHASRALCVSPFDGVSVSLIIGNCLRRVLCLQLFGPCH